MVISRNIPGKSPLLEGEDQVRAGYKTGFLY
jgi:hypothetical protein